jgi:3-hydroxymyristoyl/3-hydroxydecanoyl-(acyl carrier protein) dehydratase
LIALAACIAAALVFRRFVFVAYYPVVMSAALAIAFGTSLLRKTTLCESLAASACPLLPDGANAYCRKLTAVWFGVMILNGCIALATVFAPRWIWILWNCALSYAMTCSIIGIELAVRRRKFARTFHTSGSTSAPKTIVKTFDSLAKEVVFHKKELSEVLAKKPTFLSTVTREHMYGTLWMELLPRAAECPVEKDTILSPEELTDKMKSAENVVLITTPSFLSRFTAYAKQYDIPRNTLEIVTSGALLASEVSLGAKNTFGIAPREIFGSTETGGVAWRRQHSGNDDWRVFPAVKVRTGEDGRLIVNSPYSFKKDFVMGDAVELAEDGKTFKLLGRKDRVVKIAEQRIDLPEAEAELVALPCIKDAALCPLESEHGTILGAVIVADKSLLDSENPAMELRRQCRKIFPSGAAPKKFRFVPELPRNAQGKILVSALRPLFGKSLRLPPICNFERTADSCTAETVFPRDYVYFKGHFPSLPVLAGVVQLGIIKELVDFVTGTCRPVKAVKKLKFTNIVTTDARIGISITRKNENEFAFSITKGGLPCSNGLVSF